MPITCQSKDFGRTGFDLVSCGCSSKASFHKLLLPNRLKKVPKPCNGDRKSVCLQQSGSVRCGAFSTKAPETLLNGNFLIYLSTC